MVKRFSKGDLVTVFEVWSLGGHRNREYLRNHPDLKDEQVFTARFCEVTSWGAKQATLIDSATGEAIRVRVYAGEDAHIFAGHDLEAGRGYCASIASERAGRLRWTVARRIATGDSHLSEAGKRVHAEAIEDKARAAEAIERGEWWIMKYPARYEDGIASLAEAKAAAGGEGALVSGAEGVVVPDFEIRAQEWPGNQWRIVMENGGVWEIGLAPRSMSRERAIASVLAIVERRLAEARS